MSIGEGGIGEHSEEFISPAGVVSTSGGEDPESLLDAIGLTTDQIRTGALERDLVRAAQLSHIHTRFRDTYRKNAAPNNPLRFITSPS